MDPYFLRTVSYVVTFIGTAFVLAGGIGSWYFGSLAEKIAPFRKHVHSARATVEVIIASDKQGNHHYMDSGGYLILGKGQTSLLIASATNCRANQIGDNRVLFKGDFRMDANDRATDKPVRNLANAEYAQFRFEPMPSNVKILEGKAVVIVNNAIRFEIPIPNQVANNKEFYSHDLSGVFDDFPQVVIGEIRSRL